MEVLLSSVVEVLQQREEQMKERISGLESRIAELEERLAQMEDNVQYMPELPVEETTVPVEEEIEIEFEFEGLEPELEDHEAEEPVVADVEESAEMEEEEVQEAVSVMEKAKPDWFDWEVDIPGPYIEDIWDGIGLNDRMLFLNVLFDGNEEAFDEAVSFLNDAVTLVGATEYIREKYPQWDEESDEVYRFYMTVRRRFNKQKQEE